MLCNYFNYFKKEKEQFIEKNIPLSKIFNIPNGIDLNCNESNILYKINNFNSKKNKPYFFVGRLHFIKGPDLLLKAFNAIAHKIPNII